MPVTILILSGKTRKGKNRVSELGSRWLVMGTPKDRIPCSDQPGPWLCVIPEKNVQYSRWLHEKDDPDFEILSREEKP